MMLRMIKRKCMQKNQRSFNDETFYGEGNANSDAKKDETLF